MGIEKKKVKVCRVPYRTPRATDAAGRRQKKTDKPIKKQYFEAHFYFLEAEIQLKHAAIVIAIPQG